MTTCLKGILVTTSSLAFALFSPFLVERLLIPNACAYHTVEDVPWWINVFFPLDEIRHPETGLLFWLAWLVLSVSAIFVFNASANILERRVRDHRIAEELESLG